MSISKRVGKGGKVTYRVRVYDPELGKKVDVGSRAKLRGEDGATALEAEWVGRFTKGERAGSQTIREFAAEWLTEDRYLNKRPEESTRIHYRSVIGLFVEGCENHRGYGNLKLHEFGKQDARDVGALPGGRAKVAKTMFNDAIEVGALRAANPFDGLSVGKQPGRKDIDPLTEDEVKAIAQCAREAFGEGGYGDELAAWVIFQAYVGCRPGESFALTWDDIDVEAGTVRINRQRRKDGMAKTKTKRQRLIVLPPPARDAIQVLANREGWLFRTVTGKQLSISSIGYYWRTTRIAWEASLPDHHWLKRRLEMKADDHLTPYELRHFGASVLADRGLAARDIAFQLGNSAEVCEAIYTHLHEDRVRSRLLDVFADDKPGDRVERALQERDKVVDLGTKRDQKKAAG